MKFGIISRVGVCDDEKFLMIGIHSRVEVRNGKNVNTNRAVYLM